MKLATWNVEIPVSVRRRDAIRAHIDDVRADVLVLTETHDGLLTGYASSVSSAPGRDGNRKPEHHWVTIWSNWELVPIATSDECRTVAARVLPESSDPFVIYGTVLPWLGSQWREHPSAGGVAFREALAVQTADWLRIRHDYPGDELFVLGDFNQDMVSPKYYGSRANRTLLDSALLAAGLTAITAGGGDPIRRDSAPCAAIDHICANQDSAWHAEPAMRWPDEPVPVKWLSDHFGLSVVFIPV